MINKSSKLLVFYGVCFVQKMLFYSKQTMEL